MSGSDVELFGGGVARGKAGDEREQRCVCRRNLRAQQHGAMNSRGFFRQPFATGAAASGGLFFGEHYGAVGLALFAKLHGDRVRGIHFEEMVDAPGERRAEEAMAQELRDQNVRQGARCDSRCAGGP